MEVSLALGAVSISLPLLWLLFTWEVPMEGLRSADNNSQSPEEKKQPRYQEGRLTE